MGKLDRASRKHVGSVGVITTTGDATLTHEHGMGAIRDVKSELFVLAVTNMVAEPTFYETGKARDDRFVALIHQATTEDPDWVSRLIPWLRSEANMRTASVIAAAEYARALATIRGSDKTDVPGPRAVISGALQRADEPGEFLAYYLGDRRPARNSLPAGVQRGVADAVRRLYSERSAIKYDGQSHAYRFADVIELVHPTPAAPWQSALFKYLLDQRHHQDGMPGELLPTIETNRALADLSVGDRHALLTGNDAKDWIKRSGMSWENAASWAQRPMDKAAWEAMIPNMGYMALLRNLRNFDEAGVTDAVAQQVGEKLSDAEEVRKSRQFPIRFLSAYLAAPSLRWAWPLEKAVNLSLANIPIVRGRTLILIDQSASMAMAMSGRSQARRSAVAALFGFGLGARSDNADVFIYGSGHERVDVAAAKSLLPLVERYGAGQMGGTNTWRTFSETYDKHDRVVLITDEQSMDSSSYYGDSLPNVPIYTYSLGGYKPAHIQSGVNRVTVAGLTDAGFKLIDLLERRQTAGWPF